jgi:hypothetical protein
VLTISLGLCEGYNEGSSLGEADGTSLGEKDGDSLGLCEGFALYFYDKVSTLLLK